jgi:hypothetical protein
MNGNDRVKRGGEVLVFAVLALGLLNALGSAPSSFLASSVVSRTPKKSRQKKMRTLSIYCMVGIVGGRYNTYTYLRPLRLYFLSPSP